MNMLQLNRDFRRVVEHCTGMAQGTVRPANQNAGASGDSFATVYLMRNSGKPSATTYTDIPDDPDENLTETQETHARFTASVQIFRKDANILANKLRDRITLTSASQLMRSLGLGYISSNEVRDMSMVVNTSWEERAVVDIDFYVVSTETEVTPSFEDEYSISVNSSNY